MKPTNRINDMKDATFNQNYAVYEYLNSYPEDMTYDELLEMLYEADDDESLYELLETQTEYADLDYDTIAQRIEEKVYELDQMDLAKSRSKNTLEKSDKRTEDAVYKHLQDMVLDIRLKVGKGKDINFTDSDWHGLVRHVTNYILDTKGE